MKYFVTSDIHGYYDEFIKALNEQNFDVNDVNHKLIICGDLFDRGHQPQAIIDYILKHKDKIILIRGNHEDLMQSMIDRNRNEVHDLHNGTAQTIVDLDPEWQVSKFNLVKIAKQTKLQTVLDMCVDYYETEHYVFVHGWIPIIENCLRYDTDWRNARKERWDKARWQNPVEMCKYEIFEPNKKIVCGHWHCSALWNWQQPDKYSEFETNANFEPFIDEHIIAIDACTVVSHKVNVVVIDD